MWWLLALLGLAGIGVGISMLNGKSVAILGPREAGKSTLVNFLLNGTISEEYIATGRPTKFTGKKISLQEINLKVNDIMDVPGDVASHSDWQQQYNKADIACYLFDASRLHKREARYEEAVIRDMRRIGDWFGARKKANKDLPKFFLVATHCDLIPEYETLSDKNKTAFTDEFWRTPLIQKLINYGGGSQNVKRAAGSLKDLKNSERLVGDILHQAVQ